MTNTTTLNMIADLTADERDLVALGATTAIAAYHTGAKALGKRLQSAAVVNEVDPIEVIDHLNTILDGLAEEVQPNLNALRKATEGVGVVVTAAEKDKAANDVVERLFAEVFGPEIAAATRARVEAEDRAGGEEPLTEREKALLYGY